MAKSPSDRPPKDDDKGLKDKFKDSFESFKKNEKIEGIYNYATNNVRDTIAYILLVAGLIWMLVDGPRWSYGAALVGVILGLYFWKEIAQFVSNYKDFIEKQGLVRSLILSGVLLAFFIAAPLIFIGAAIAVALRRFFLPET